jgi:integrin beta 3
VLRAATSDPVFKALDSLGVPEWAAVAGTTQDNSNGSRWCLLDCRYRERTVESQKETEETFAQYEAALGESGWTRWDAPLCPPENIEGSYSCWKRDEFVLDLYVRPSECARNPLYQRPTAGGETAAPEATAAPEGTAAAPPAVACNPSVVSLKVFNAIADPHRAPDPNASSDPGIDDGLTDDDVTGGQTPGPTETQPAG